MKTDDDFDVAARIRFNDFFKNFPATAFLLILLLELSYFLTGYIFWYGNNCLNFLWIGRFFLLPSFLLPGFLILPVACIIWFLIPSKQIDLGDHIVCATILAIALFNSILLWNIPELNPDAVLWYYQADYMFRTSVTAFFEGWGVNFPVVSGLPFPTFMFGLLYKTFGEHRIVIQIGNSLFFSSTAVVIYFLCKEIFSKRLATYSALFFASSPFAVSQTALMLPDTITTFSVTLAIYFAVLTASRGHPKYPMFLALATSIALMSKYTASIYLIPLLSLLLVYDFVKRGFSQTLKHVFLFLISLVPVIILAVLWRYDVFVEQFHRYFSYLKYLGSPVLNPTFLILVGLPKALAISVSIPVFVVSLHAILSNIRVGRGRIWLTFLLIWVIVPTYLIFPSTDSLNSAARYITPTFPAYCILAGMSVSKIRNMRARRGVLGCLLIFSAVTANLVYGQCWSQSVSRNIMDASFYLNTSIPSNATVGVFSPYMATWFDIYTDRKVVALPPDMSPFSLQLEPIELSQAFRNGKPDYFITVDAVAVINQKVYTSMPSISMSERAFLYENYILVREFSRGELYGPWYPMTVNVYRREENCSLIWTAIVKGHGNPSFIGQNMTNGNVKLDFGKLEDGTINSYFMLHPKPHGKTWWNFTLDIPSNSSALYLSYGFLYGANRTDGATFQLLIDGKEVFSNYKAYTGTLAHTSISLEQYRGKEVTISLCVDSYSSSNWDWAAWIPHLSVS